MLADGTPPTGVDSVNKTEAFDTTDAGDAASSDAEADTAMFDGSPAPHSPADETQTLDPAQLAAEAKKISTTTVGGAAKTSTLGDYKLLKKLGQGGMGAVYKAHQISLDREVAVKILSKELAGKPAFVQRFLREAQLMAKLDHPNILRCFEIKEAQGYHYLSVEYVEGGSLEDWLRKLGKFELGDALHAVVTIAHALEHAHEKGLIHRDIKPDNILLTKKGVIKIADLGLAKKTDDSLNLTRTGTGAGTPLYMAPEQARDVKHVDRRCDVYALGVMLYVFLTGDAPFQGATLVEVIEAKEKGKFKPIRSFNPDVPERVDLIVDKMLAKDVKHRYATCAEVASDLEALGMASDQLSFLDAGAAAAGKSPAARPSAPTKSPAAAAKTAGLPGGGATTAKVGPKAPPFEDPKPDPNIWYWKLNDPKGRPITKKVTTEEVMTLIKSGSIDAKAQLSKTLVGGYRAVGAFLEFETYFRGKIAEKKAGRGADKYKDMLQQIEQEEARKQRWKGFKRFFSSFGSFVGLLIWLAVLGGAIAGIWFLVKKFVL
jgi:serine/threonine-protein kinase